jgi:hypothetical protein
VDDVTWGALTLSLTVLGGIWTWLSFRRRGLASGLRALAFTLLPVAAYLTKTLQMFTRIANAIGDWAVSLAWNPLVWSGVVLAGVSVVLFVVSGALRSREVGKAQTGTSAELPAKRSKRAGPPALGGDDDMAEIEALLRKRGID